MYFELAQTGFSGLLDYRGILKVPHIFELNDQPGHVKQKQFFEIVRLVCIFEAKVCRMQALKIIILVAFYAF